MMYDFIHLPKAAGTSLRHALQKTGIDVISDYSDPLNSNYLKKIIRTKSFAINVAMIAIKKDVIIFGHHSTSRYKVISNRRLCTFVRDPVDLLCSYYYYSLNKKESSGNHIVNKFDSVEDFLQSRYARLYYNEFYNKMNVNDFYFIGVVEKLAESICLLETLLQVKVDLPKLNVGVINDYNVNVDLVADLKNNNLAESYLFYDKSVEKLNNDLLLTHCLNKDLT
jgi:hypothetical protein